MERKIGDVFTFDGKQLEVIKGDCWDCYFFWQVMFCRCRYKRCM